MAPSAGSQLKLLHMVHDCTCNFALHGTSCHGVTKASCIMTLLSCDFPSMMASTARMYFEGQGDCKLSGCSCGLCSPKASCCRAALHSLSATHFMCLRPGPSAILLLSIHLQMFKLAICRCPLCSCRNNTACCHHACFDFFVANTGTMQLLVCPSEAATREALHPHWK